MKATVTECAGCAALVVAGMCGSPAVAFLAIGGAMLWLSIMFQVKDMQRSHSERLADAVDRYGQGVAHQARVLSQLADRIDANNYALESVAGGDCWRDSHDDNDGPWGDPTPPLPR